jgi:RimJ/RimL family protein N-acetyltransferase
VRLEPWSDDYLPVLRDLLADPDTVRFTRVPEPVPVDFERTWAATFEQRRVAGTGAVFAMLDDGDVLGLAFAPHLDTATQTAELGYVVAPWARGRGVASEALRQLTDWAFGERGMVRLELYIDAANEASKRVAQRAGYTFEGVLRSRHVKPSRRADTELWSRLVDDPQAV